MIFTTRRLHDLAQIVRRNIGRHSDGDTGRTVDQTGSEIVPEAHVGSFSVSSKFGDKIYRIFSDVRKHFHGNLGQSCLSVSHGSSAVAIDGTEVSVAVDQRISGLTSPVPY